MNRDPRGYYAALRVTPDATAAEIQRAFRALMRLRHPDVDASSAAGPGPGNNEGDEARRILESFAVLRDPRSRAEYDPAAALWRARAHQLPAAGRFRCVTTGRRARFCGLPRCGGSEVRCDPAVGTPATLPEPQPRSTGEGGRP